jgi:hypothetical protein
LPGGGKRQVGRWSARCGLRSRSEPADHRAGSCRALQRANLRPEGARQRERLARGRVALVNGCGDLPVAIRERLTSSRGPVPTPPDERPRHLARHGGTGRSDRSWQPVGRWPAAGDASPAPGQRGTTRPLARPCRHRPRRSGPPATSGPGPAARAGAPPRATDHEPAHRGSPHRPGARERSKTPDRAAAGLDAPHRASGSTSSRGGVSPARSAGLPPKRPPTSDRAACRASTCAAVRTP